MDTEARAPVSLVPEDEDTVRRLVRLAAPGPAVPVDGAARVKAALRPQWRQAVRARSVRRLVLWAGAGLAAAAVLAIGLTLRQPPALPEEPVATLTALAGTVEIVSRGGAAVVVTAPAVGTTVERGALLRTTDASRTALRLGGGQSLRLDTATRVRLDSARAVTLERGAVYLDSGAVRQASLEVRTALGVVRDVGTQFLVRRQRGEVAVHVRQGSVVVAHRGGEVGVTAGTAVTISANGGLESTSTQAFDSEWDWVQRVAPPFAIEGRPVTAFLGWVERETGLVVEYSTPEVASLAGATVLHGVLVGPNPIAAAELILPSCGLRVAREPGRLVVERSYGSGAGG